MLIPAPAAQPCTAAITGTGQAASARAKVWNSPAIASTAGPTACPAAANAPTSPPVQKLAPPPVSRIAPVPGPGSRMAAMARSIPSWSRVEPRSAAEITQRSTRSRRGTVVAMLPIFPPRRAGEQANGTERTGPAGLDRISPRVKTYLSPRPRT